MEVPNGISGSTGTTRVTPSSLENYKVRKFNEPEGNYQYSPQVYTKPPIQPKNYDTLFAYLFGITDPGPFLEIYTTT
jgi:hypothetical protein